MLHLAVIYNMVDIVERLVKLGEDRNVKNKVYNTLIASASRKQWPKLVFLKYTYVLDITCFAPF